MTSFEVLSYSCFRSADEHCWGTAGRLQLRVSVACKFCDPLPHFVDIIISPNKQFMDAIITLDAVDYTGSDLCGMLVVRHFLFEEALGMIA
jgi:hypothetical protein